MGNIDKNCLTEDELMIKKLTNRGELVIKTGWSKRNELEKLTE